MNIGVKLHQKMSFSKLFTSMNKGIDSKKVFMPGCSLSSHDPDIVIKTYEYLKQSIPELGIILKCCAAPSKLIKNEKSFEEYYSSLEEDFNNEGINEVITACQSCYKAIKDNSPNIKIKSLWEEIDRIGIPDNLEDIYKNIDVKFAIHDSCPTRKESNIHSSIRNIANSLDLKIEEFDYCKENTKCCGAKLMLTSDKNLALDQMKKRANEVSCDYILTYCQSCRESMNIGGKNSIHILDLMFNKSLYRGLNIETNKTDLLKKWSNRYKCKKMIDELK